MRIIWAEPSDGLTTGVHCMWWDVVAGRRSGCHNVAQFAMKPQAKAKQRTLHVCEQHKKHILANPQALGVEDDYLFIVVGEGQ